MVASAAAEENHELKSFVAKYEAYAKGFNVGEAIMSLDKEGDLYKLYYESDVSLFFYSDKRTETSLFKAEGSQLIPVTYHYTREGTGKEKDLKLSFDSDKKLITKGSGDPINWQGEWDNQLYRFDLQRKLRNQESDIKYNLMNYRGQLKTYGFEVVGEELLELPYGKINAIKVKTIRTNNKRVTWSWFAPDLNYQLVKLQQFKKGKKQGEIELKEFTVAD